MKKLIGVLGVLVIALSWILYKAIQKIRSNKEWNNLMYSQLEETRKELYDLREERREKEFSKKSPNWNHRSR